MPEARPAAIVTGSTSGIGRAIAVTLLRSGYAVVLNYSASDERAAAALAECQGIDPGVMLVKADVSNPSAAADLVARAIAAFGRLDVLVNNAARVIDKPALDMTEVDWDSVVD